MLGSLLLKQHGRLPDLIRVLCLLIVRKPVPLVEEHGIGQSLTTTHFFICDHTCEKCSLQYPFEQLNTR